MLIRVRSREGLIRLTIDPVSTSTLQLVRQILLGLQYTDAMMSASVFATCQLSRDPAGKDPIRIFNGTTVASLGMKEGDMIYIHNLPPKTTNVSSESESSQAERKLGEIQRAWTMKSYLDYVDSITPKFRPQGTATCAGVLIDSAAAQSFQQYLQNFDYLQPRVAYLFGRIDLNQFVFVDAIYEPPQELVNGKPIAQEDPVEMQALHNLCTHVGLMQVGWIIARPPKSTTAAAAAVTPPVQPHAQSQPQKLSSSLSDSDLLRDHRYQLSGDEVLQAANAQIQNSPFAVTIVVQKGEAGDVGFEAFQVSDQAVNLLQAEHDFFSFTEQPGFLRCKRPVKIDEPNAKERKDIDTDVLVSAVRLGTFTSSLKTSFPIENRLTQSQEPADALKHLRQRGPKLVDAFSDFHFLLYMIKSPLLQEEHVYEIFEAVKSRTEPNTGKRILSTVQSLLS